MKFEFFKKIVDSLAEDNKLCFYLENKETLSEYENKVYKIIKNRIPLKEELLKNITGEDKVKTLFKIKFSILEKYLIEIADTYNLKFEIAYLDASKNFVENKPFVDIRFVEKSTDNFGDLFYHIEYLQNITQPLDKENTYIFLKPLLNPFAWNEICQKYKIKDFLWESLNEQLLLNNELEKIDKLKLNLMEQKKYFNKNLYTVYPMKRR